MKKRLLAGLLCTAMLASAVGTGSLLPVSGGMTAVSFRDAADAAHLPAGQNLLTGILPVRSDGGTLSVSHLNVTTDGAIPGITETATAADSKKILYSCTTPYALVYDLGVVTRLDRVLVARSTEDDSRYQVTGAKIFVGNDPAALLEGTPAAELDLKDNIAQMAELSGVSARYVAFLVPPETVRKGVRLTEIGVYGEVRNTTAWLNSAADVSRLPAGTNLLTGLSPVKKDGTAVNCSNPAAATDGLIRGVNSDTVSSKMLYGCYPAFGIVYDLGQTASVEQLLLAVSGDDILKYRIAGADVYIGKDPATLFDGTPVANIHVYECLAAVVTLDTATSGRYVGFMIAGDAKQHAVRIGELGVYGTVTVAVTALTDTEDEAKLPVKENLLTGMVPTQADGTAVPYDSLEPSTDGIIVGITRPVPEGNPDSTDNKMGYGNRDTAATPIVYDMKGTVKLDQLLLAASGWDNARYRIASCRVYVGNKRSTLFAGTPVAIMTFTGMIGQVLTFNTTVEGRYIGFDIPGDSTYQRVRIGEIGIYGAYTGEKVKDLILGQTLVESYIVSKGDLTAIRSDDISVGDPIENWTDGNLDNRGSTYSTYGQFLLGERDYISAQTPWQVLIYHLGGTAAVENITLTSSRISMDEMKYHVAGVQYYVGATLDGLLTAENKVYDTHGDQTTLDADGNEVPDSRTDVTTNQIICGLDDPRQGRYVAVVITRPHVTGLKGYSVARIGEIEVFGTLLQADVSPVTRFTDTATGIAAELMQLNNDDVDLYSRIAGIRVTQQALPDTVNSTLDNGWLIADSPLYTVSFVDGTGQALPDSDLGERRVTVYLPHTVDYAQLIGRVVDGKLQRVTNSRVLNGVAWVDSGIGNDQQIALLRFAKVADSDGDITARQMSGRVAGAADVLTGGRLLWWLAALAAVAGALLVLAGKHHRREEPGSMAGSGNDDGFCEENSDGQPNEETILKGGADR